MLEACDENTKIIWICSPNNPTGNSMNRDEMLAVVKRFDGFVIIDEAYEDFASQETMRKELSKYENLIILNTFSKAWGCAAIRLGMAFAHPKIIEIFNKVKYPYNVNLLTQQHAREAISGIADVENWVKILLEERAAVMTAFAHLPCCEEVYPTDANFFLVRVTDAQAIYDYLVAQGIIVRNRTRVQLCQNCLRITIGTKNENSALIEALKKL